MSCSLEIVLHPEFCLQNLTSLYSAWFVDKMYTSAMYGEACSSISFGERRYLTRLIVTANYRKNTQLHADPWNTYIDKKFR